MRANSGLDLAGQAVEMIRKMVGLWLVYGFLLKIDPTGFITGLDVGSKRRKGITNASKDFGLSI